MSNFAFGMYFCLIWCGQSILLLSPLYLTSAFLHAFDMTELFCAGATIGVVLLFYFLHYKFKKPFNTLLIMLYGFLSQVAFMYIHSEVASEFFDSVLAVALGLVFLYCSMHLFQNVLFRGLKRKFFIDEGICAGVVLTVVASGLYNVPMGEYISLCVAILFILVILFSYGASGAIVVGTLVGLGISFCTQDVTFIVRMVLMCVAGATMKTNKRIFSVLSVILVDVFTELYLMPFYAIGTIISISLGAILFLIIPTKWLAAVAGVVVVENKNNALYDMLECQRKDLHYKLGMLSNVFFEMKNTYLDMVKKNYSEEDVYESTNTQVVQNVCLQCPNRDECLNINNKEINYHLKELAKLAYSRGKVSLAEVSPNFAYRCIRLPIVVNAINHNVSEYKHTIFDTQSGNEYKLMVAEQLFGVSRIFKTLSSQLSTTIQFDIDKENEIIERLAKNHILCTECLVYNESENNIKITLNVRNKDLLTETIERLISSCVNTKMQVHSIVHSTIKNYSLITLKNKNVYEMVFGCAGVNKHGNKISGDTYSVAQVGADQVVLSICDGMGSGQNARDISKRCSSLISNFYKAGFDTNITLKIVNNLLSQRGEDNFSAIDLGVVNLRTGILDLYKVGAPCSFIKKENETIVLYSQALPLGIINNAKPCIQSVILGENDYIILVSDGVVDALKEASKLKEIINNIQNTNPQAIANELLDIVIKTCNSIVQDDMTVVVGKLIKN
ncbi:MAG: SpoIIE family protein phosphatase [Clostridia bacterium]|nr:SpoIIE family protein phosphatase [Clostridia bacterium]